jgi:hypothetical protein
MIYFRGKQKIFSNSAHECDELVIGYLLWFLLCWYIKSRKVSSFSVKCHFIYSHFAFCCCFSIALQLQQYILLKKGNLFKNSVDELVLLDVARFLQSDSIFQNRNTPSYFFNCHFNYHTWYFKDPLIFNDKQLLVPK